MAVKQGFDSNRLRRKLTVSAMRRAKLHTNEKGYRIFGAVPFAFLSDGAITPRL